MANTTTSFLDLLRKPASKGTILLVMLTLFALVLCLEHPAQVRLDQWQKGSIQEGTCPLANPADMSCIVELLEEMAPFKRRGLSLLFVLLQGVVVLLLLGCLAKRTLGNKSTAPPWRLQSLVQQKTLLLN